MKANLQLEEKKYILNKNQYINLFPFLFFITSLEVVQIRVDCAVIFCPRWSLLALAITTLGIYYYYYITPRY